RIGEWRDENLAGLKYFALRIGDHTRDSFRYARRSTRTGQRVGGDSFSITRQRRNLPITGNRDRRTLHSVTLELLGANGDCAFQIHRRIGKCIGELVEAEVPYIT